ncbi:MAG: hypothetical protein J5654_05870 [Victivallales bacterium]|nr:hypothetical protein [Victivallales bacterium]
MRRCIAEDIDKILPNLAERLDLGDGSGYNKAIPFLFSIFSSNLSIHLNSAGKSDAPEKLLAKGFGRALQATHLLSHMA